MATVDPSQDELRKVLQETPKNQPVVMLNLLRFRDQAAYKDDTENCSGRDAYKRYVSEAAECVKAVGAEVIWSGRGVGSLIAPPDESWDQVLLVRYPSISAFLTMIESPDYKGVLKHRAAALEDSRLVANVEAEL